MGHFLHVRQSCYAWLWDFSMHMNFVSRMWKFFFTHGKQFCHACTYKRQANAKHSRINPKWLWKCTLLPSGLVHWAWHTIPTCGPSAMRPVTAMSFISIIGMCLILQVSTSLFCLYFCNKFKQSICYQCFRQTAPLWESCVAFREGPQKNGERANLALYFYKAACRLNPGIVF